MKLAALIDQLVALQNQHGNLDVLHHDAEYGLTPASAGLAYIATINGRQQSFDAHGTYDPTPCKREDLVQIWNSSSVSYQASFGSMDAFIERCETNDRARIELQKQILASPLAIVI